MKAIYIRDESKFVTLVANIVVPALKSVGPGQLLQGPALCRQ